MHGQSEYSATGVHAGELASGVHGQESANGALTEASNRLHGEKNTNSTLPQTGEDSRDDVLAAIGLANAGLVGLLGLAGARKRKNQ